MNIPLIWVFREDQFQAEEDVDEDFEIVDDSLELVYLVLLHNFTSNKNINMRKVSIGPIM